MKLKMVVAGVCLALLSGCQTQQAEEMPLEEPVFKNVSVHDPSIIKDSEGEYFIIGSHMQAAKSSDLIQWQQISADVTTTKLFEDIHEEFKDEFAYAQTGTFWAGDVIQLKDGKYYMYYCLCRGDSPLSVLGVAVADQVDGPYKKVESFLYSGTSPQFGKTYDATKDPNAIDPHVFYGHDEKLWMVYG
ncbi:MAG: family 43 glycosylhydrolase, partial [Enterococcus sp.]|nr:family 43 glycosylhydrolase [Enterococcus sp.]